jgi:hypothetical protein
MQKYFVELFAVHKWTEDLSAIFIAVAQRRVPYPHGVRLRIELVT